MTYKGMFKDNVKHGQGEEKGDEYYFKGIFDYGEKKSGLLKYGDNVYEGKFQDDKYHGKGNMVTSEGIYNGDFKHGKQDGYGEFKWKNKSVYRGHYSDGIREG